MSEPNQGERAVLLAHLDMVNTLQKKLNEHWDAGENTYAISMALYIAIKDLCNYFAELHPAQPGSSHLF